MLSLRPSSARRARVRGPASEANDSSWTQVGNDVSFGMSDPVYIGLAVTSGIAGAPLTATFDNVSITQT